MPNVEIKIKTEAVGTGTQDAEKALKSLGQAAAETSTKGSILTGIFAGLTEKITEGAAEALHKVAESVLRVAEGFVEGVKSISEYAARMEDLSASTGQSVEDVIVLGQAFRNAGLGSESVGQSLFLLQKALGGMNEEGLPTAKVFERLGLSIDELKNISATEALAQISAAIASLPTQADQARAAMEMFGRSGRGMLAVLKDTEGLEIARTQIGGLAANVGGSAQDLKKFGDAIASLDLKSKQFFAGFAAGVAGDLKSAADAINAIDLSPFGTKLAMIAKGAQELADNLAKAVSAAPKEGEKPYSGGDLASDTATVLGKSALDAAMPGGELGTKALGAFISFLEDLGVKRKAAEDAAKPKPEEKPAPPDTTLDDAVQASRDRVEADRKRQEAAQKAGAEVMAADKFKDMSPQEQLADLDKRRMEQAAVVLSSSSSDEEKNKALEEATKLLAQELDLRRKIKENDEKLKAFSDDIAIGEAEAAKRNPPAAPEPAADPDALKWNRDREKVREGLHKMGSTDEWGESARKVNLDAAKSQQEKADKLESLRLELEINEAMDAGNTKLAEGLKWNRDRVRFQKELQELGSKDSWGESARMANEATGKHSDGPQKPADLPAGFLTQLYSHNLGPAVDAKPVDRLPEVVTNTAKIETAIKELTTVVANKEGDVFT